jgi:hypothetical protein
MINLDISKGSSLLRFWAQPSEAEAVKIRRAITGIRKTGNIRQKDDTKANGLRPNLLRFALIALPPFLVSCLGTIVRV